MKKVIMTLGVAFALIAGLAIAADHIEAPAVTGTSADITDYYAFENTTGDNMVFVCNTMGLLAPSATANAAFDENQLVEFNIDNDGDFVEDLVIQCRVRNGELKVYGPMMPSQVGKQSTLALNSSVSTPVTGYSESPVIATSAEGVSIFAGPRDDPFFMDFTQFGEILAGNATGFNNPGMDTFAGTNVLSIAVEVPKSILGGTALNTWVESKTRIN